MKQLPLDLQRKNFKELEVILDGLRASLGPDHYEEKKLRILDQIRKGEITPVLRKGGNYGRK